jgi:hypothetical protein
VNPWIILSGLWAQTTGGDADELALLALRRWYASLTLASPDPAPNRSGLWAWLGGLGLLFFICLMAQGPRLALRQLFDLPGHFRLSSLAGARLRRSGRLIAVTLGATVIAWTASQTLTYSKPERLNDLVALKSTKSLREISVEHAILAALTPYRDVMGLGDNLLLLLGATFLAFKLSASRWGTGPDNPSMKPRTPLPPWTTLCWGGTALYAFYRGATLVVEPEGLPLGGCFFVEAAIVPALMAVADGLILAWILVELRKASQGEDDGSGFDMAAALPLLPSAILACFLALPARYVATADYLTLSHFPSLKTWAIVRTFLKGWGLVDLQGVALLFAGLAGVVAWRGRTALNTGAAYWRVLQREGGHLTAIVAGLGAVSGLAAGLAYFVVLSLPAQSWVLGAADSYAHYATLPFNLLLLAAVVELGARSLVVGESQSAAKVDEFAAS